MSSPLRVARLALNAFTVLLVFIAVLNVYLVFGGLGRLELKAARAGEYVVIRSKVANKGFLPLSLRVDLELCGKNFTWSGVISPGNSSEILLVVPENYTVCRGRFYVHAGMGGLLYVRLEQKA